MDPSMQGIDPSMLAMLLMMQGGGGPGGMPGGMPGGAPGMPGGPPGADQLGALIRGSYPLGTAPTTSSAGSRGDIPASIPGVPGASFGAPGGLDFLPKPGMGGPPSAAMGAPTPPGTQAQAQGDMGNAFGNLAGVKAPPAPQPIMSGGVNTPGPGHTGIAAAGGGSAALAALLNAILGHIPQTGVPALGGMRG